MKTKKKTTTKTRFKVEIKIKGFDELRIFENVSELFIENNFLILVTYEGKDQHKLEPIDLFAIDYWREIGKTKKIPKKK